MSRESKAKLLEELIAAFRASSSQEAAFDAVAAARLGVGSSDLRCLDIVQGRGGVTAGELAAASGLTTGAVTAVVDRLERAGFVRRVRDASDRRKVNINVTDMHYARTKEIWEPLMQDWMHEIGGDFTADELRTVTRFLEQTAALTARHADRLQSSD